MWIIYNFYLRKGTDEVYYVKNMLEIGTPDNVECAWFPVQDSSEAPAELTREQFKAAREKGKEFMAQMTKGKR